MKFVDFDKMIKEMKRDKLTIKVYNQRLEVIDEIPASIILELMKYDANQPIPPELIVKAAMTFFGEDTIREWARRKDFSMLFMTKLVEATIDTINSKPDSTPNPPSKN